MRLTLDEQQVIINSFAQKFGQRDHLWLFGSRANDKQKGGDIDLYIETELNVEQAVTSMLSFETLLQDLLGEQKIDVVLNVIELNYHQPIYDIAKNTGVLLV